MAQELVQKELNNGKKTFKIETNRADKSFPLTSIEITKSVGSYLFKNIKGLKSGCTSTRIYTVFRFKK